MALCFFFHTPDCLKFKLNKIENFSFKKYKCRHRMAHNKYTFVVRNSIRKLITSLNLISNSIGENANTISL